MKTRTKRRKAAISGLLLFSPRDQVRFVESVERFNSLVNDLAVLVDNFKRKSGLPRPKALADVPQEMPDNL